VRKTLKIAFGLDLDGYQDLQPRDRFNESICGPHGFLGLLEVRLGLASKPASAARRIVQYRESLGKAASIKRRFFTASLTKDPFAVAETLLCWRDELVLAGWDGSADPAGSSRLRDLADVEELGGPDLWPGFGDRIRTVLAELDRRDPGLSVVEVVEDREDFPLLLRNLLVKLEATFGKGGADKFNPAGCPGTDLRKLQEALTNPSEQLPIKLACDGSITFVTAYSEVTLAHLAAQLFQKSRHQNRSTTMVAQSECSHLDAALRSLDEPVLGLSARSAQRPVLQTLALALALRWEPLDPRDLLAFLVHPISPMNDSFRAKLADVVAERPGIGGTKWNRAIEKHREYLEGKLASDTTGLRKALRQVEESLSQWVAVSRFDAQDGAPGFELAATCAAIVPWAMGRAAKADLPDAMAEQYAQLVSHASDLAAILRLIPTVSRAQLDRLVDQVIGSGVRSNHSVAESGHVHRLTAPGSFLEPVETVLWWDFQGSGAVQGTPWTNIEIEQFKRSGVELLLPAKRSARENLTGLRIVLGAKKQLLLMCPRVIANEPALRHPYRDRIQSLLDGALPIFDLDRHLADPVAAPAPQSLAPLLRAFPCRQLPEIRRWWKLNDGQHLGPRDFESFTSAKLLIFNPSAWVLQYKAQLRSGRLFRNKVTSGCRQRGNLLHRLNEMVFVPSASVDWKVASRMQVEGWLEVEWQKLLPTEGANLLLPGSKAVGDGLLEEAKRAIWRLIEHLRAAAVIKTTVNVEPPRTPFVGGKMRGVIDLLVENTAGCTAVVDFKYGGCPQKKEELAHNLHLQLAVYGRLIAQGSAWPDAAFFILGKRALLAQDRRFFAEAEAVPSRLLPSGLEVCWNEFEVLWKWRRRLLDQGWIECAVSGSGAANGDGSGPRSTAPCPRWQLENAIEKYNDFDALTGWEENA
jgi:ATP-dependent helicase/nuclease subunit B